jgi:hypothetical protein
VPTIFRYNSTNLKTKRRPRKRKHIAKQSQPDQNFACTFDQESIDGIDIYLNTIATKGTNKLDHIICTNTKKYVGPLGNIKKVIQILVLLDPLFHIKIATLLIQ